jgi:hypothetical protein
MTDEYDDNRPLMGLPPIPQPPPLPPPTVKLSPEQIEAIAEAVANKVIAKLKAEGE